jgi:2'-5' RNA ligase
MNELAVVAFPEFASESERWIGAVRSTYDSLAASIAPHVTLVFPTTRFDAGELISAMESAIDGVPPLSVTFREIQVSSSLNESGWVVYLVADRGNDELTDWHLRLHAGELVVLRAPGEPFRPHVTVGRFPDREQADALAMSLEPMGAVLEGQILALELIEVTAEAIRSRSKKLLGDQATFRL